MRKLLSSEELGRDILDVPTRTLDQWAYLGKGPAFIKIGRHRRYRLEDVEAWIETHRRGGQPAPRQPAPREQHQRSAVRGGDAA